MLKPMLIVSAFIILGLSPLPQGSKSMQEPATPPAAKSPAPVALPSTVPTPVNVPGTAKNPVHPTTESQARAKKLWTYDCQMCHNENGDGKSDLAKDMGLAMTDLTNPTTLSSQTDQQVFELIKTGKGKMPGEADRAKTDELWNLVIYVRALSKGHTAEPVAEAPKASE